jgi:hypothetical protein
MLQGDALAVQLFIGAAAISALSVAMTQAGWTHRLFIFGMFSLAAILGGISVGWPFLEARIPAINSALQTIAQTRVAWFLAGIIPAVVAGVRLNEFQRRRKTKAPNTWLSIFEAMEKFARQDLLDRFSYVESEVFAAARHATQLDDECRTLGLALVSANDEERHEWSEKLAKLTSEKDETYKKHAKWVQTEEDCREALRMNIHDQLLNGSLLAKGFLSPHTPSVPERIIPQEEWRFLSLDWEGNQALGPNFEYIAVLVGRPGG